MVHRMDGLPHFLIWVVAARRGWRVGGSTMVVIGGRIRGLLSLSLISSSSARAATALMNGCVLVSDDPHFQRVEGLRTS